MLRNLGSIKFFYTSSLWEYSLESVGFLLRLLFPNGKVNMLLEKINYGLILMYGHTTKLQISVKEIMKILAII